MLLVREGELEDLKVISWNWQRVELDEFLKDLGAKTEELEMPRMK